MDIGFGLFTNIFMQHYVVREAPFSFSRHCILKMLVKFLLPFNLLMSGGKKKHAITYKLCTESYKCSNA
jgi:hypothetical protein